MLLRGGICFLLIVILGPIISQVFIIAFNMMGYITTVDGIMEANIPFLGIFLMIVVRYLCFFGIFVICATMLNSKNKPREMLTEYRLNISVRVVDVVLTVMLSAIGLCTFIYIQAGITELITWMGWKNDPITDLVPANWGEYIGYLFALAVLPAIVEELVFRGLILNELKKYGKVVAVLISAILFSLFHMSAAQTIYQFALGIIFAVIVIRTGSLVLPMIMHFLNNALVVTYTFIAKTDVFPITWNAQTIIAGIIIAALGIVVIMGLLNVFKKRDTGWNWGKKRFVEMDSVLYFVCIGVTSFLWIIVFVSQIIW